MSRMSGGRLSALSAVALLVLLAAPTRTRIVASDFGAAHHLLRTVGAVAAEMQRLQLLVLLALDVAREVLHRALGGLTLQLTGVGARGSFLGLFLFLIGIRHRRGSAGHLEEEQIPHRFVLDAVHH